MQATTVDVCALAVVAISAATDIARGRIYNAVTYPAIAAGVLIAATGAGPPVGASLAGGLVGGGALYVMFALGWMGGGDVKLMAAVGTLKGFPFILNAMFYSIFLGGAFAALVLVWRGEVRGLVTDLRTLAGRALGYRSATDGALQPRGGSFPFGVAIALGTAVAIALEWVR